MKKKKRSINKVISIPISVYWLIKKWKTLDWMLHHILCFFTGVATAAWQQCAMFSFGEIPTFKKSRGGAERYRPYEYEFPSREYNLSGGHVIIINDIYLVMFLWFPLILYPLLYLFKLLHIETFRNEILYQLVFLIQL